tara:strand:- start:318 stop:530 length:213 start_codon:yes stop_codon:yes gene_type:complete
MATEQELAYQAKKRFCYIELKKWMVFLCDKRTIAEVEKALAAALSITLHIKDLDDKIYNETTPEYDDPLI